MSMESDRAVIRSEQPLWIFPLVCLAVLMVLGLRLTAETSGYGGDGTMVFPGSNPPTSFDLKGENLVWKTKLANWGLCQPMVTSGKVFITIEEAWPVERRFPTLVCLDADTGKELWNHELDHLSVVGGQAKGALEAWSGFLDRMRGGLEAYHHMLAVNEREGIARLEKLGISYKENRYNPLRSSKGVLPSKEESTQMKGASFFANSWPYKNTGNLAAGNAFATPISDGEHVWVISSFGAVFCFAMDGQMRWIGYEPRVDGAPSWTSPVLKHGLLIDVNAGRIVAYEKKTGAVAWKHAYSVAEAGGSFLAQPAVITCDGQDILIVGPKAYTLPDGKSFAMTGYPTNCLGTTYVVDTDRPDVIYHSGGGESARWTAKGRKGTIVPPSAVRWSLEGEELVGEVLWSGIEIDGQRTHQVSHTGITYYQGRLYHGAGYIIDAATGKVLAGAGKSNRATPPTVQFMAVTDRYVIGYDSKGNNRPGGYGKARKPKHGLVTVYDHKGQQVSMIKLADEVATEDDKQWCISLTGEPIRGGHFPAGSYSGAFTITGDRIYLRSGLHLYCVGTK